MGDQNTRPQPSAEPVAVWRDALSAFAGAGNQAAAAIIASALEEARREALEQADFQKRVGSWMEQTFPPEVRTDRIERAMRFLEEATELCQSIGLSREKAGVVLDYVFGRPVGEPWQEVGGSMVTLAALCEAIGQDMAACGEREFARIDTPEMRAKIAAKQVSKRLFGMTSALKENTNG